MVRSVNASSILAGKGNYTYPQLYVFIDKEIQQNIPKLTHNLTSQFHDFEATNRRRGGLFGERLCNSSWSLCAMKCINQWIYTVEQPRLMDDWLYLHLWMMLWVKLDTRSRRSCLCEYWVQFDVAERKSKTKRKENHTRPILLDEETSRVLGGRLPFHPIGKRMVHKDSRHPNPKHILKWTAMAHQTNAMR